MGSSENFPNFYILQKSDQNFPKFEISKNRQNLEKFDILVIFWKKVGYVDIINVIKVMFSSGNLHVHILVPGVLRVCDTSFSPNFDEIWSKFVVLVDISGFCKTHILPIFDKK